MTRRLLIGTALLLGVIALGGLFAGAVQAQNDALCPDDTLNWLIGTSGALPPGTSLHCRSTSADMVWVLPPELPPGYTYAYTREEGNGYYDVFLTGGELAGPVEICFRGVQTPGAQTVAVWSGPPPNQWYLVPSWRSGDSVCAQTRRLGGFALMRTLSAEFDPEAGVNMTDSGAAVPRRPTATPRPVAQPAAPPPAAAGGGDLTIVAPGTADSCLVRANYIVRMRALPNTSAAILDRVPYQTTLRADLRTTDNAWLRVNYLGQLGWVYARYLSLSSACEQLNGIAP